MGIGAILPYEIHGVKAGIADNTATDILRVRMPNEAAAVCIRLTLLAVMNGSTDDHESARVANGLVVAIRKNGAAAVATAASIADGTIATTSGGGTITLAYAVSSISGAAGDAENTFTITVTIVKTGTVTDHRLSYAVLVLDDAGNVDVQTV
jgi:hypothetical protein